MLGDTEPKEREEGEHVIPQEWVGKRVEVDLVRPGAALTGATYRGTLNAVTDLGIAASLSADAARPGAEGEHEGVRERFYPWGAVLCIDLAVDTTRGVAAADRPAPLP